MTDQGTSGRLLAALPTPFDEKGRFDAPAMVRLVDYFSSRAMGLAVLTEVGEGCFLDSTERRAVVERVAQSAQNKVPFWVEVQDLWTRTAVDAARHAEESGAAGLFLSLQDVPGIAYAEFYRHLDRVAKATSGPLVLVVRPGHIMWGLAPEEQDTIAQHPRLSGVLVVERCDPSLKTWIRRFEDKGGVFGSCSFGVENDVRTKVRNIVCALSVLAPEPSRVIIDSMREGDLDVVRRLNQRMKPALERLGPPLASDSKGSVERLAERIANRALDTRRLKPWAPPGLIKEALRLQGHRIHPFVRPPQPQVTAEARENLKALLRTCGMLG